MSIGEHLTKDPLHWGRAGESLKLSPDTGESSFEEESSIFLLVLKLSPKSGEDFELYPKLEQSLESILKLFP